MIEELLKFIPKEFYELPFYELNQNTFWNDLPEILKKEFFKRNLDSYSINDQNQILDWLNNESYSHNSTSTKDKIERIIEFIKYSIDVVPYHRTEIKITILTKYKESKLKDFILGENIEILEPVYNYIDNLIDIITKQSKSMVIDESSLENESKLVFQKLQKSFNQNCRHLNDLLNTKDENTTDSFLEFFVSIYIKSPNLLFSNSEFFEPYSIFELKKIFKEITKKKNISIKALNDLIIKLEITEVELKNLKKQAENELSEIDPRMYYYKSRNQMYIQFYAKSITIISHFISYIKKNYINKRRKVDFPKTFEEAVNEIITFHNVLKDLEYKGYISEMNGKYKWNKGSADLVLLLDKFNEIELLKHPTARNSKNYGMLLNKFFNLEYDPRSYQPSNKPEESNKFFFLNKYRPK